MKMRDCVQSETAVVPEIIENGSRPMVLRPGRLLTTTFAAVLFIVLGLLALQQGLFAVNQPARSASIAPTPSRRRPDTELTMCITCE